MKLTLEKIDSAIAGLEGLRDIIVPFLLNNDYEGLGVGDSLESSKHLAIAVYSMAFVRGLIQELGGEKYDGN